MLVSTNLLKQYIDFDLSVDKLSEELTMQGLEVEEIIPFGIRLDKVEVAQIESLERHPNADKLSVCVVDNGSEKLNIICGASNMTVGDNVCLAMIGASLPDGLKIKKAKLRGVESFGMLCSKSELGLEDDSEGIWILPPDAKPGEKINLYLPEEDSILNIALTANRGDCLSLIGVAREIGGMVSKKVSYPNTELNINNNIPKPDVKISDKDSCFRYTSRIIKGIEVKESPPWLKEALIKLGSRPINNVVDISNFVLLELGHPLHAFDLNKLKGQKIIVRKAKASETIIGIDGVEQKLSDEILVISDENNPVAIAGVMGGEYSGVTSETKDILLESAYFLPESVRSTSKKLDLSTESSYRFERGTDIDGLIKALDRCAKLIQELCGGEVSELLDVYPNKKTKRIVDLRISFVNERLGTNLNKKDIIKYLDPLEFIIKEKDDDTLTLTVPSFKTDVLREIDVVEEIVRIYGYNNIKETILPLKQNPDFLDTHTSPENKIKDILIGFGLIETLNYSFTSEKELDKLKFMTSNLIKTKNPLTVDNESLRNTLLHGAVNTITHNVHHGNKSLSVFEIGNIFYQENNTFIEKRNLSISLFGLYTERGIYTQERSYDFFDLKGIVEGLIFKLTHKEAQFETHSSDFFHPSKSAKIILDNTELGIIGECHPQIQDDLKLNYPILFAEINLDKLQALIGKEQRYNEISKFPEVLRDLAILVDANIESQKIQDEIKKASKYLTNINLVDVYQGKHIPENKKSLAFSLSFQDPEKTLSDKLVNKDYDQIVNRLRKNLGGEMRAS